MSLVVETGSGASNSESYISVANADTYHASRGNTLWASMLTAEKEQAIRRATDWMEAKYSDEWKGHRVQFAQALSWPRYGAKVNGFYLYGNYVPLPVVNACAEMAFRAAFYDLATDSIGPEVASVTVGPISKTYAVGARAGAAGARPKNKYEAVEDMLSPFLDGGGSMVKMVRG